DKSYVHNTIYDNPNIDYEPWRKADGSRYDTGTRLDAVWGDASLLSDKDDISDDTHVYFVPKKGITDYNDQQRYYRYELRNVSNDGVNGPRVIQIAPAERTDLLGRTGLSSSDWLYYQVVVPAGMTLTVEISGSAGLIEGHADLYVRRGANPTASNYLAADTGNGNNHRIVLDDVQSGTYHIGLRARSGWFGSSFSGVRLVAYYETSGTSFATPVAGRSEA